MLFFQALATVALTASSLFASISDQHQTTVTASVGKDDRFVVSVKRIDDLLNDDGKVVSEKWSNVVVSFQVDVDGQITANGKPVKLGLSKVEMEADTIEILTEEAQKMTTEQLENAYDKGVVAMDIVAVAERVEVLGIEITKVILVEKIIEVNGVQVEQSVSMQQIFEIKEGSVSARPPCESMHSPQEFQKQHVERLESGHDSCSAAKAAQWLRAQPPHIRVVASIFSGAVFGLLILVFTRFVTRIFMTDSYHRPSEQDVDESFYISKITLKKAEAGESNVEEQETLDLPEYATNGYTVVKLEEKQ